MSHGIDVHAHFFNARYLPLTGIFRAYGAPPGFAGLLDVLVTCLTGHDRRLDRGEMPPFASEALDAAPKRIRPVSGVDGPPVEATVNESVEAFCGQLSRRVLRQSVVDEYFEADSPLGLDAPIDNLDARRAYVHDALVRCDAESGATGRVFHTHGEGSSEADESGNGGVGLGGVLEFVMNLTSCERTLVRCLQANSPGIGLFVHHMMDMDPSLNEVSEYAWPRQVRRVRELCRIFKGRVVAFIGFNPYRAGDQSLERARWGLENGFLGVKFHPSMGFRASENGPVLREADPGAMDQRCKALFELCVDLDAPVMAHCGPDGLDLGRPHGHKTPLNSDPEYWDEILEALPDLRICFGHAGSSIDWDAAPTPLPPAPTPVPWTPKILELCAKYRNVYTDLGHYDEVMRPDTARTLQLSLERAVGRGSAGGSFDLGGKLLYGSDFPMPVSGGWGGYHRAFRELFRNSDKLDDYEDAFFGDNAREFLNIGGFLRTRLDALSPHERNYLSSF